MADSKSTPKAATASAEEDFAKSTQAQFSTYSEMPLPKDAPANPPPGKLVQQELGEPSEGAVTNVISGETGTVEKA